MAASEALEIVFLSFAITWGADVADRLGEKRTIIRLTPKKAAQSGREGSALLLLDRSKRDKSAIADTIKWTFDNWF